MVRPATSGAALLALLVLCTPASAELRRCAPKRADVVAQNRLVQVYDAGDWHPEAAGQYACLRDRRGWVYLSDGDSLSEDAIEIRLAATYVAFRVQSPPNCKGNCPEGYEDPDELRWVNVRTRRVREPVLAVDEYPRTLRLTKRGTLAWTAELTGGVVVVRTAGRFGRFTLDRGAIAPRSLRLRGNVLSWIRDGRRRSVTLG